jgi:hypothetical protein
MSVNIATDKEMTYLFTQYNATTQMFMICTNDCLVLDQVNSNSSIWLYLIYERTAKRGKTEMHGLRCRKNRIILNYVCILY